MASASAVQPVARGEIATAKGSRRRLSPEGLGGNRVTAAQLGRPELAPDA
jgi:hypothetical protein